MNVNDRSIVPCNGCTACCQNDLLILHPECGDEPADYETMECINPVTGKSAIALKHKPEGGCIYLGSGGCTIWDRAPAICREFDCRKFYAKLITQTTRRDRRKSPLRDWIGGDVLRAGRRRLGTLP